MALRAAVLVDELGRSIGKTMVPETTFVIAHKDGFYFRTAGDGVRLAGGGVGARFIQIDPLVRNKLEPL